MILFSFLVSYLLLGEDPPEGSESKGLVGTHPLSMYMGQPSPENASHGH